MGGGLVSHLFCYLCFNLSVSYSLPFLAHLFSNIQTLIPLSIPIALEWMIWTIDLSTQKAATANVNQSQPSRNYLASKFVVLIKLKRKGQQYFPFVAPSMNSKAMRQIASINYKSNPNPSFPPIHRSKHYQQN